MHDVYVRVNANIVQHNELLLILLLLAGIEQELASRADQRVFR